MRILNGFCAAAVLATVFAAPTAALTYSVLPGAPDPGPSADQTIFVDFDTPLADGFTLSGDYAITSGSASNHAAPAGDASRYLVTPTPPGRGGSVTLSTLELTSLSFYWGSVDDYNFVDVLGRNGTILGTVSGLDISPANGDRSSGATNQRIFFTAGTDEFITGIRLRSEGIAFEIDDVAGTLFGDGTGSTVPEPASWVMLILGFGMTGFAARRRRPTVVAV